MRQRHSVQTLARAVFSGLLLWLIVGYILYPMAQTVVQSFSTESGFGLAGYRAYFSNPQNRLVIRWRFICVFCAADTKSSSTFCCSVP